MVPDNIVKLRQITDAHVRNLRLRRSVGGMLKLDELLRDERLATDLSLITLDNQSAQIASLHELNTAFRGALKATRETLAAREALEARDARTEVH